MAKPVVGIIGNSHLLNNEYPVQAVGVANIEAVADLTGAIPLIVPAMPRIGAISDLIAPTARSRPCMTAMFGNVLRRPLVNSVKPIDIALI